jgi:OHCU decarboxylase
MTADQPGDQGLSRGRLGSAVTDEVDAMLASADSALAAGWPGDPGTRQPVHTLYVPADRITPDLVERISVDAQAAVDQHGGHAVTMADVTGLGPATVEAVWPAVLRKLAEQPVEDLRLDLEDGYGARPDTEEDGAAVAIGELLSQPSHGRPFVSGSRIKSFEAPTRHRGIRSLDLLLASVVERAGGLPSGFVVTLPKVTSVEQVRAMVHVCEHLERAYGLLPGSLRFELQVETPQAVLGADGTATVARMVHAANGRCSGLHYGTYDYSASLGVAAAYQAMDHPVADYATSLMQLAAAQTGTRVSHGSTNVLPVGSTDEVRAAWALHSRLVRRSLERGIYQGWDLHPAQLVTRYLATYAFYREGMPAAVDRLRAYAARNDSGILDEPATAYALASFLVRGVDCGALDGDEVLAATGLDRASLNGFARRSGGVERLDRLPVPALRDELFAVCSSARWVDGVAAARPYRDLDSLLRTADDALAVLDESDLDQALAGHPRIGERSASSASRCEQSGVTDEQRAALLEANRAYEERFRHVYLVCASGRSGAELLDVLSSRLGNSPEAERRVMREELGKINALRLRRLVEEG